MEGKGGSRVRVNPSPLLTNSSLLHATHSPLLSSIYFFFFVFSPLSWFFFLSLTFFLTSSVSSFLCLFLLRHSHISFPFFSPFRISFTHLSCFPITQVGLGFLFSLFLLYYFHFHYLHFRSHLLFVLSLYLRSHHHLHISFSSPAHLSSTTDFPPFHHSASLSLLVRLGMKFEGDFWHNYWTPDSRLSDRHSCFLMILFVVAQSERRFRAGC